MQLSLFCPKEDWEGGEGNIFLPEEKLKTFSSRIFLLGKILVLTRWNDNHHLKLLAEYPDKFDMNR